MKIRTIIIRLFITKSLPEFQKSANYKKILAERLGEIFDEPTIENLVTLITNDDEKNIIKVSEGLSIEVQIQFFETIANLSPKRAVYGRKLAEIGRDNNRKDKYDMALRKMAVAEIFTPEDALAYAQLASTMDDHKNMQDALEKLEPGLNNTNLLLCYARISLV